MKPKVDKKFEERSRAPSAPSVDQLRSRLLSPRQKGQNLRPATHSIVGSSHEAGLSDFIGDSFSSLDWNISNFETVKSEEAPLFFGTLNATKMTFPVVVSTRTNLSTRLQAPCNLELSQSGTKPHASKQSSPDTAVTSIQPLLTPNLDTLDTVLAYFSSLTASAHSDIAYVHATPRYNVENLCKDYFYDFVILDHLGNVQMHTRKGSTKKQTVKLQSSQLIQISRNGILMSDPEDRSKGCLIPLSEFLNERELFFQLQKLSFFLKFKEIKTFSAWHLWARSRRVARARKLLKMNSFFSHTDIAAVLPKVVRAVHALETEVELFAFHGVGAICVTKFIALQIEVLKTAKVEIYCRIRAIGDIFSNQLTALLSGEEHRAYVEAVIQGHPFVYAAEAGEVIDWVGLRSLQRLQEDCRSKLENLLCMAHYMVEGAIAKLLTKFWLRMAQFVAGIRRVSRRSQINGYWDLSAVFGQSMDAPVPSAGEASEMTSDDSLSGGSFFVDSEWLEEGSHLSVDVNLCLRNESSPSNTLFLLPENIRHFKVKILPSKSELQDQLHHMYGHIGSILENLPSLKSHPLIDKLRFKSSPLNSQNLESDELGNINSKSYFTRLHMNPILNSGGGIVEAAKFLKVISDSHLAACNVTKRLLRMEEQLKRICALNPDGLSKQLNVSLLLPKIIKVMESPESVDDLHRALVRDKGRLASLHSIIADLDMATSTQSVFMDIKHHGGMVTAFNTVTQQLLKFCEIQRKRLFGMLPNSFSNRCKRFCDYMEVLESHMELDDPGLRGLILLLKKNRNFESCLPLIDLEMEICEQMYKTMEKHVTNSGDPESKAVAVLSRGIALRLPDGQYRHYLDLKNRLFSTITRGKTLLLGMLAQIKKDSIENRRILHERIDLIFQSLQSPMYIDSSSVASVVLLELKKIDHSMVSLRLDVESMLETQLVLTTAHDLIGAANVILCEAEVDHFVDMPQLELLLAQRSRAWNSVHACSTAKVALTNSRIGSCNVRETHNVLVSIQKTMLYLTEFGENSAGLITFLKNKMEILLPIVELVSYLSCSCLRSRHLKWLSDEVLSFCGYQLKFSGRNLDIATVIDTKDRIQNLVLGSLSSMPVSELLERGVGNFLGKIRIVTSVAVVESLIETTLYDVEETIRTAALSTSTAWLRDSKLREKIFFELYQATNLTQVRVVLQYCQKATLIIEQISMDMKLSYFNSRIENDRESLLRLDRFIESVNEIQRKWMYVFHFIKFSRPGDLDRESTKTYQMCTEELKRIELAVQQKSGNLLSSCASVAEYDNNIETCKQNLSSLMEDAHSNVQSLLDECPRLSLISYNRLQRLINAWLLGPHYHLDLISDSFHDMFEGCGKMVCGVNVSQRTYFCSGVVSFDASETVVFETIVDFMLPLPEFVNEFENQLRRAISRSSDELIVQRIQMMRSLLQSAPASVIVANIENIFSQRLALLLHLAEDSVPNQSYILVNSCCFAEDVWASLGHPTGSLSLVRADLTGDSSKQLISTYWQESVSKASNECKENIKMIVDHLQLHAGLDGMKPKKSFALFSSLFLQEVYFLRILEQLSRCKCLESACEFWAGKFQIKFLYVKDVRTRGCPFDVLLGCVTIPYGLEYQGGHVRVVSSDQLEDAVQKVVSSAFCSNATIFVNHDDDYSPVDAVGEFSVPCKDVATALGRICFNLMSVHSSLSARLFFSRLLYLDAVGCVDFTSIDHGGLQLLVSTLSGFWKAIEEKNDTFIQDSLKFPLKTKFSSTEKQLQRRKDNLILLRGGINSLIKQHKFAGILVVALASETQYSDPSVFDYFSRSIFDTIAMPHCRPIEDLGLLLSIEGFVFGLEIQSLMHKTIVNLRINHGNRSNLMSCLSSSRMLRGLANDGGKVLLMKVERLGAKKNGIQRLKLELECFVAILWEHILLLGDQQGEDFEQLRNDCVSCFRDYYLDFTRDAQDIGSFSSEVIYNKMIVPKAIVNIIRSAAKDKGVWCGGNFTEQCACLWNLITNPANSVVILSGATACGKSTIIETVIEIIRRMGVYPDLPRSCIGPIKSWRAGYIIAKCILNWYRNPSSFHWKSKMSPKSAVLGEAQDPEKADVEGVQEHESAVKSTVRIMKSLPIKKLAVKVFVIYHTSLSSEFLLGSFDGQGRWMDGLLIRKIRESDKALDSPNASSMHLIVLDGPLNYFVEQIFGASHCLCTRTQVSGLNMAPSIGMFPSGEIYRFDEKNHFLLETDDVSHASPALIVYTPHYHVATDLSMSCFRILKVWCRSLTHWLGNFPPWRESLTDITEILTTSNFVWDILSFTCNDVCTLKPCLVVSCIGTFLRYLEELLSECHLLTVSESSFVKPDSEESDDDSTVAESEADSGEDDGPVKFQKQGASADHKLFSRFIMVLGEKGRERLKIRSRLLLVYSALWGLGGSCSSNESRKKFDTFFREIIYHYFEAEIEIPKGHMMFDFSIDLKNSQLTLPVQNMDQKESLYVLPQRLENLHLSAELLSGKQYGTQQAKLFVKTPSVRAVEQAIRYILSSGGHPLVIGSRCIGKTTLVSSILKDLRSNLHSPQHSQKYFLQNLVDIIGERSEPEGVSLTLQLLRRTLKQLRQTPAVNDETTNFSKLWESVQDSLKSLATHDSSDHCKSKTIFSSSVSLQGTQSADSLRRWFEREFCSEVKHCLETPRFSYGVVFVDDLHVSTLADSTGSRKFLQNRPEALLKGLLSASPLFSIVKNLRMRLASSSYTGSNAGLMEKSVGGHPTLHRCQLTDPRTTQESQDNFIMQHVGMIACASGEIQSLISSASFCQTIKHFGIVALPELQTSELHAALIIGSFVSLNFGSSGSNIVETLRNEITDLASITIAVSKRMVSSSDALLTSSLERSIRKNVALDINLVSQFCASLQLGSCNIENPGGLLQLYVHEWKRFFIDPFPIGAQRERFLLLFREELDVIDSKKWFISSEWLENIISGMSPLTDRVWANPLSMCKDAGDGLGAIKLPSYSPLEQLQSNGEEIKGSAFSSTQINCSDIAGANVYSGFLFPAATSLLLRMVRILESGNSNLLVYGYHGSTKTKGLQLAAKICSRILYQFEAREHPVDVEGLAASTPVRDHSFRRVLKAAVLRAAGFVNSSGDVEGSTFNPFFQCSSSEYLKTDPSNVILSVSFAQQLAIEDRILLLNALDGISIVNIFDDHEIIGMSECLRKQAQLDSTESTGDSCYVSNAVDDSGVVISFASKSGNRQREDVHSTGLQIRNRTLLSGYAYHWVKFQLQKLLGSQLLVVLDCDIPRTTRLQSQITTELENNSSKDHADSDSRPDIHDGAQTLKTSHLVRRYSLLSSADSSSNQSTSRTSTQLVNMPDAANIFTCELLGPIFRQTFCSLWWEMEVVDASTGFTNLLIRNDDREISTSKFRILDVTFRATTIGEFHYQENIGVKSSQLTAIGSESGKPKKIVKRKKWAETLGIFRFQLHLQNSRPLTNYLGVLDKIGMFRSYQLPDMFPLPEELCEQHDLVKDMLQRFRMGSLKENSNLCKAQAEFLLAMKEEARAILAMLLVVPAPCDALLLLAPVLSFGPEKIAQIASEIALNIFQLVSSTFFCRRHALIVVLEAMKEAEVVISAVNEKKGALLRNYDDIYNCIRRKQFEADSCKQGIENINFDFQLCPEFEIVRMMSEEQLSRQVACESRKNDAALELTAAQESLSRVSTAEWFSLAAYFAAKPEDKAIEVMKTVMLVINFSLPEVIKKKGKSQIKSDFENISRSSISLIRSPDFVNQLLMINPDGLTSPQADSIAALKQTWSPETESYFEQMKILVNYLFSILKYRSKMETLSSHQMDSIRLKETCSIHETRNLASLNSKVSELNAVRECINEQMMLLDLELQKCRRNIDLAQKIIEHSDDLKSVLLIHKACVETELEHIDSVLKTLVADTCIAAVVFARSSWLPEEIRQECLGVLRAAVVKTGLRVHESPFVLGAIIDNDQIRRWSVGQQNSIPRDPSAINTMALACISPWYTFVIDPDGVSDAFLLDSFSDNYKPFLVSAQKFSLVLLESWIEALQDELPIKNSVGIVITDAQAGCSDDLILFLSADLMFEDRVADDGDESDTLQLIARFCHLDENYSSSASRIVLPRIRLYIVSTTAPIFEESGPSAPLPLCCFKNMCIIHWVAVTQSTFYVESKPLNRAMNKSYATEDCILRHKFLQQLGSKISPSHHVQYRDTNDKMLKCSQDLELIMNVEYSIICKWVFEERDQYLQSFLIKDVIHLDAVTFGFLNNLKIIKFLMLSEKLRLNQHLNLMCHLSFERDLLAYEAGISETLSMTIDALRMCSCIVPTEVLPPYALSPRTLCSKYLAPALAKGAVLRIFHGLPSNLSNLRKFKYLKTFLQNKGVRKYKKPSELSSIGLSATKTMKLDVILENEPNEIHDALQVDDCPRTSEDFKKFRSESISTLKFGMTRFERELAVSSFNFLLLPLRSFLLKEVMAFLLLTVRPGHEWLVKLSLLIAMWSKTSTVPEDEVRTLLYFISNSFGKETVRYSHVMAILKPISCLSRDFVMNRVGTILECRSSFRNAGSSQSLIRPADSGGKFNREKGVIVPEEEEVKEEDYDDFSAGLNDIVTMSKRVTAFRSVEEFPIRKHSNRKRRASESLQLKYRKMYKSFKGRIDGAVDGLMINRNSNRWKLCSSLSVEGVETDAGFRSLRRFEIAFCDDPETRLLGATALHQAHGAGARLGDAFEMERLQVSGVKLFSTYGIEAVSALGASRSVFTSIVSTISQNRSTVFSSRYRIKSSSVLMPSSSSRTASTRGSKRIKGTIRTTVSQSVIRSRTSTKLDRGSTTSNSTFSRQSVDSSKILNPSLQATRRRQSLVSRNSIINKAPSFEGGSETSKIDTLLKGLGSHRSTICDTDSPAVKKIERKSLINNPPPVLPVDKRPSTMDVELSRLLTHVYSRQFFTMLETHSSLSKIFKGMSRLIPDRIEDFLEWKEEIAKFGAHEFVSMSQTDLEQIAMKFTPPNFIEEAEADELTREDGNDQTGLWLKGYELTILQTILFSEAINPGSAAAISNACFGLISEFIQKGGRIVEHGDEVQDDDEDDEMNGTVLKTAVTGSDDEESDEDEFDSFVLSSENYSPQAMLQSDASFTNCWSKLRRVVNGQSQALGTVLKDQFASPFRLTCRDFDDWERVLLDVLRYNHIGEKFTYMGALRSSFLRDSSVFLCNPLAANQMSMLSQRARSLGVHNDCFIPVINCRTSRKFDSSKQKAIVTENIKNIKQSISGFRVHKAIVEMLDLSSSSGNAIIASVMNLPGRSPHDDRDSSSAGRSSNSPKKFFPLIITSEWAGHSSGLGPMAAVGDLNFVWLPRMFAPDVVGSSQMNVSPQFSLEQSQPGVLESGGIICEELESCLLWVMISCRRMPRASISPSLLRSLRHAKKVEVRTVSCLLAIWRLVLYQRSRTRDSEDKPGMWCKCTVPLSLWQLARLIMKTTEILNHPWFIDASLFRSEQVADKLLEDSQFLKGVHLLAETLGLAVGSTVSEPTSKTATPASFPRKDTMARTSVLVAPKPTTSRYNAFTPSPPTPTKPTAAGLSVSIAMSRIKKKAAAAAALSIQKHLDQLRSVDRFSIYSNSVASTLLPSAEGSDSTNFRKDQFSSEVDEGNTRLLSFLAVYLAEVLAHTTDKSKGAHGSEAESKSFLLEESESKISKSEAHRLSMKLDIASFISRERGSLRRPGQQETPSQWPGVHRGDFDMTLGSLDSPDLLRCMVRWTFDGEDTATSVQTERKKKIRESLKAKILSLAGMGNR